MEWLRVNGRFTSGKSQSFLMLLAGLLVSLFAGIFVSTTPVAAADVTWDAGKLVLNSETYSLYANDDMLNLMGIPEGSQVYATQFDSETTNQTVKVLYFSPGIQPDVATSMELREFTYTPPDTWQQTGSSTVSVDNTQAQPSIDAQCGIPSIGWLVCGPTMFIANGMDWIYSQLISFLEVRPMETDNTTSSFYQAWSIMRDIANAAFVVAFLIIVYSHVSNFGVSAYGVKKMAPRLVIAALLVNASFIICAILVDLSNVAGYAIKDVFDTLLEQLVRTSTANNAGIGSFADVAQTFISGGTLLLAGGAAVGASLLAATPFLIPLLATLFVALLVALLVMAARQALIVILTLIAPLAFVCYLLPGTEKWFEKWRNTFFTMLIFFPAFSFVFGASQLAGSLITSNAQSTVIFILGMAVQLAPLAITPLILKLGGGLLNRFAGIVNDPTKGLVDKSKQWAQNASKDIANRRTYGNENLKGWNLARRAARYGDRRSRLLKDRMAESDLRAENSYRDWEKYKQQDIRKRDAEMEKQAIDKQLELSWNTHLKIDKKALEKDLTLRLLTDKAELSKLQLDNRYEETKAGQHPTGFIGPMAPDDPMLRMINETRDTAEHLAAQGLRKNNAQRVLNQQLAENMLADKQLQEEAGGIYGSLGADAAVASAISTMRSEYGKSVEEGRQIVKHFNLSSDQRQQHALGQAVTVTDSAGNSRTFDASNTFTREAVIEDQIAVGTVNQVKEIVQASGSSLSEYKTTISEAIAKSGVKGKAPYLGGKLIDDIAKGTITSEDHLLGYIQDWIADGKYRDEDIAITDPDGLKLLMKAARSSTAQMNPGLRAQLVDGLEGLSEKAATVLTHDDLKGHVSKKAQPLMEKISRGDFTP